MDNEVLRKIVHEAKAIILDIEGTTSSIDFMRKEVFPYAENHLEDYVMKHWQKVRKVLLHFQELSELNSKENPDSLIPLPQVPLSENTEEIQNWLRTIVSYLKRQMNSNPHDPAMKQIQGLILQDAFTNGEIKAHVYPDALKALEIWFSENKQIYTYSTGMQATQVEYFRNATHDSRINGYFDTSIGSKLESEGYKYICDFAKVVPGEVVFFSDRPKEIFAAKKCGLKAILVDRESQFSMIKAEEDFLGHEDGKILSFIEIL